MENVAPVLADDRMHHSGLSQDPGIERGICSTLFGPFFQVPQLHAQHRPLNPIHPVVVTLQHVVIPLLRAPITQHPQLTSVFGVVGYEGPAFAVRSEILSRIETEAADVPNTAGSLSTVLGSVSLTGVFDH